MAKAISGMAKSVDRWRVYIKDAIKINIRKQPIPMSIPLPFLTPTPMRHYSIEKNSITVCGILLLVPS
jgi:hypothetical protein